MNGSDTGRQITWTRLIAFGILLQAGGCSFDSEEFFSSSIAALYNNIATTFIITTLADLLNVSPTF